MFTWKIIDITSNGEYITSAHFYVKAEDGENTVETEGNCELPKPEIISPFDQITEAQVIGYIQKETMIDGQNSIELRLAEQLEVLKNQKLVKAPWVKATYKPTL